MRKLLVLSLLVLSTTVFSQEQPRLYEGECDISHAAYIGCLAGTLPSSISVGSQSVEMGEDGQEYLVIKGEMAFKLIDDQSGNFNILTVDLGAIQQGNGDSGVIYGASFLDIRAFTKPLKHVQNTEVVGSATLVDFEATAQENLNSLDLSLLTTGAGLAYIDDENRITIYGKVQAGLNMGHTRLNEERLSYGGIGVGSQLFISSRLGSVRLARSSTSSVSENQGDLSTTEVEVRFPLSRGFMVGVDASINTISRTLPEEATQDLQSTRRYIGGSIAIGL